VAQNHFAITRCHRLAPGGIFPGFLIDRNAFAEPARHFIARQLQGDDVTKLMPEHGLPVCRVGRLRRRTVRRHDMPEADADKSWASWIRAGRYFASDFKACR